MVSLRGEYSNQVRIQERFYRQRLWIEREPNAIFIGFSPFGQKSSDTRGNVGDLCPERGREIKTYDAASVSMADIDVSS